MISDTSRNEDNVQSKSATHVIKQSGLLRSLRWRFVATAAMSASTSTKRPSQGTAEPSSAGKALGSAGTSSTACQHQFAPQCEKARVTSVVAIPRALLRESPRKVPVHRASSAKQYVNGTATSEKRRLSGQRAGARTRSIGNALHGLRWEYVASNA